LVTDIPGATITAAIPGVNEFWQINLPTDFFMAADRFTLTEPGQPGLVNIVEANAGLWRSDILIDPSVDLPVVDTKTVEMDRIDRSTGMTIPVADVIYTDVSDPVPDDSSTAVLLCLPLLLITGAVLRFQPSRSR
jgi:hypothetical protein